MFLLRDASVNKRGSFLLPPYISKHANCMYLSEESTKSLKYLAKQIPTLSFHKCGFSMFYLFLVLRQLNRFM